MATKSKLAQIMVDLEAAGLRSFKAEHLDSLIRQLYTVDDNTLERLAREYIRLPEHPKSFVGWVLNRKGEEIAAAKKEFSPNCGVGVEYTQEDMNLFFKCVNRAIQIYPYNNGNGYYATWVAWFNQKWMELRGEDLTQFLRDHHEALNNSNSMRFELTPQTLEMGLI